MRHLGTDADVNAKREKYARVERERRFLLRELPAGLTRADPHLQLFDNYITNTRLRLRKVRVPETREWIWKLTQKFAPDPADLSRTSSPPSIFRAQSMRRSRSSRPTRFARTVTLTNTTGAQYAIDVFLGALHGLILAETDFANDQEMRDFQPPPFIAFDVTGDEMFTGGNLVHLSSDRIRATLKARMNPTGEL